MRLTYPQAPPEVRDLAYKALNMELLRHPQETTACETVRANAHGHVPDLHKVFLLPLLALAQGKGLRAAKHVAWYDIVVLSGLSHGAEVARAERGSSGAWVTRGDDVDAQLAALTALTESPSTEAVEVRVLRIPKIASFCFWLHFRNSKKDRIVPILSSSPELRTGEQCMPAEFLKTTRETAVHMTGKSSLRRRVTKANRRKRRANRRTR